jgi:hypothetical protein
MPFVTNTPQRKKKIHANKRKTNVEHKELSLAVELTVIMILYSLGAAKQRL